MPGVQQGPGASHLVSAASVRVVEVVDYLELDHPGKLVGGRFNATIYLHLIIIGFTTLTQSLMLIFLVLIHQSVVAKMHLVMKRSKRSSFVR